MSKHNSTSESAPYVFIEKLTLPVWWLSVFPNIIGLSGVKEDGFKIFWIDASPLGRLTAALTSKMLGWPLQRLDFCLVDIRDESGGIIRLRLNYDDMFEAQDAIMSSEVMKGLWQENEVASNECLQMYLKKSAMTFLWCDTDTVVRLLTLIQIAAWKNNEDGRENGRSIFFVRPRLWQTELNEYAARYRTELISTLKGLPSVRQWLVDKFSETRLRSIVFSIRQYGVWGALIRFFSDKKEEPLLLEEAILKPKVWTEYYGHLNLKDESLNSDLFFWQASDLAAEDQLLSFNLPVDPLTAEGLAEIKSCKIYPVGINPHAVQVRDVPIFHHRSNADRWAPDSLNGTTAQVTWAQRQWRDYFLERDYWQDFCRRTGTKIHVSWYKIGPRHCVITDALRNEGGVTAVYQRSWEEFRLTETALAADVAFGFSANGAKREKESGSKVSYYIVTGYLGDHRFAGLKQQARDLRQSLTRQGAKHAMAFLDENSGADSRWHTGHEIMWTAYEFLLKKVIEHSDFGLIIKPKVPTTLRKRLQHLEPLLDKALATKRCVLLEGGKLHSRVPPALAAQAADVAVHSSMCSVTAGLECVLTGTPTLLFDSEGWPVSPLYELGEGRVVFNQWDQLWDTCQQHWTMGSVEGFGDWSKHIHDFDPFRDGKAAARMGIFLNDVLGALKSGQHRDEALALAAQNYAEHWGSENVIQFGEREYVDNDREQPLTSVVTGV